VIRQFSPDLIVESVAAPTGSLHGIRRLVDIFKHWFLFNVDTEILDAICTSVADNQGQPTHEHIVDRFAGGFLAAAERYRGDETGVIEVKFTGSKPLPELDNKAFGARAFNMRAKEMFALCEQYMNEACELLDRTIDQLVAGSDRKTIRLCTAGGGSRPPFIRTGLTRRYSGRCEVLHKQKTKSV
jgi:hypothetical protein